MYSQIDLFPKSIVANKFDYSQIASIKNIVRNSGIPINFIGYKYIIEALIYMINSEEKIFLNQIYILLSELHKTSSECIEASIRNAIRKAITINNINMRKILNIPETVNLSNSIFLNSVKEIIVEKNFKINDIT